MTDGRFDEDDHSERQELVALGKDMLMETFGTLDAGYIEAAARVHAREQDKQRTRRKLSLVWDRDAQQS